jgi:hypothetical protein
MAEAPTLSAMVGKGSLELPSRSGQDVDNDSAGVPALWAPLGSHNTLFGVKILREEQRRGQFLFDRIAQNRYPALA